MSDEFVWCCRQCGKIRKMREHFNAICLPHAMRVKADSIVKDARGRVVQLQAVEYHPPGPGLPRRV